MKTSTLDDIDEDEPAPLVIGAPSAARPANPSVMDDLFGPPTTTTTAPPIAAPVIPGGEIASIAGQQPKATDALDDFFGQSSKIPGGKKAFSDQHVKKQQADVFDSLFASPAQTQLQTTASSVASPLDPSSGVVPMRGRSAKDQLDAFSAVMNGGSAPWTKTASVADSRVIDLDNASSAGLRVFVPPDSVLSLMTLYDVLGAAANWPLEEIGKAYKKKCLLLHPDKLQGGRTAAEERYFKIITAAYDVMKDDEKRAAYDAELRSGRPTSSSWLHFVA